MVESEDSENQIEMREHSAVPRAEGQASSLKQRAREVMGLSVAVILGFNIGDGNIRDKLDSGADLLHYMVNVSSIKFECCCCIL